MSPLRHLYPASDYQRLTLVLGSSLKIQIFRRKLTKDQQIKHDNKSGYFLLYNEKDALTVSLVIEPAVKCKTSVECRNFVWKTSNSEWGKVQDVVQSKIGDVSYLKTVRISEPLFTGVLAHDSDFVTHNFFLVGANHQKSPVI